MQEQENIALVDTVYAAFLHGDHLDGPTLEWIAANRPHSRLVIPAGIGTVLLSGLRLTRSILMHNRDETGDSRKK